MAELLLARIVAGATSALDLAEEFLFQRQLLGRRFEDKSGVAHAGGSASNVSIFR